MAQSVEDLEEIVNPRSLAGEVKDEDSTPEPDPELDVQIAKMEKLQAMCSTAGWRELMDDYKELERMFMARLLADNVDNPLILGTARGQLKRVRAILHLEENTAELLARLRRRALEQAGMAEEREEG